MSEHSDLSSNQNERDKLGKMWSEFLSKIDHDFATPLVTINMICDSLLEYLPDLLKGYQLAVDSNLIEPVLEKRKLKMVGTAPKTVIDSVGKLFEMLEWLRPIHRDLLADSTQAKNISSDSFIEDFINQPVFSDQQRQLMQVNQQHKFHFKFHDFFHKHLLLCLSDITADCWKDGNANMEISTYADENYHFMSFKVDFPENSGRGLPSRRMNHFFFKTKEGDIIQLPFCKLALMQLGADINYQFKAEECLDFTLSFPQI